MAEATGVEVAVEGEDVIARRRAEGFDYLFDLAAQQLGWTRTEVESVYRVVERDRTDKTVDGWSALLTLARKELGG